jgi:hypothetical protein
VLLDPVALKDANRDTLYGEERLYAGQQLRLPRRTCFNTTTTDCYTVTDQDTSLLEIAEKYGTTPWAVCAMNSAVWTKCDAMPVHTGMELTVPFMHATPPDPKDCKEVPGVWTCYTVAEDEIIWDIAAKLHMAPFSLISLNFNATCPIKSGPDGERISQCGSTKCPLPNDAYPECMEVGHVLVAPVITCTPQPGEYGCVVASSQSAGFVYEMHDIGSPPDDGLLAKANARWGGGGNVWSGADRGQILKAAYAPCIPNDISYCNDDTSSAGVWDKTGYLTTGVGCPLEIWDGNAVAFSRATLFGGPTGEYRIPRGSVVPGLRQKPLGAWPLNAQSTECTPIPGKHLCHKPMPGNWSQAGDHDYWGDTIDDIAAKFGVDSAHLCSVNNLVNCSAFYWEGSSVVIPIDAPPAAKY